MSRHIQPLTIAGPRESGAVRRWFAFLGGSIAWTLDLMLSYAIAEFGCIRGLHHTQWLGLTLTAWLLIGLTVAMFALAAAAAWAGYPADRRRPAEALDPARHADDTDRIDQHDDDPRTLAAAYVSQSGFLLSGLFAIVILGQSVPLIFYLHRC